MYFPDVGGTVDLDCDGTVTLNCKVKNGGVLRVKANNVVFCPGFQVDNGGILNVINK